MSSQIHTSQSPNRELEKEIVRRAKRAAAARKSGKTSGSRLTLSQIEQDFILEWRQRERATQQQTDVHFHLSPGTTARLGRLRTGVVSRSMGKSEERLESENEALRRRLAALSLTAEAKNQGKSETDILFDRFKDHPEVFRTMMRLYEAELINDL